MRVVVKSARSERRRKVVIVAAVFASLALGAVGIKAYDMLLSPEPQRAMDIAESGQSPPRNGPPAARKAPVRERTSKARVDPDGRRGGETKATKEAAGPSPELNPGCAEDMLSAEKRGEIEGEVRRIVNRRHIRREIQSASDKVLAGYVSGAMVTVAVDKNGVRVLSAWTRTPTCKKSLDITRLIRKYITDGRIYVRNKTGECRMRIEMSFKGSWRSVGKNVDL